MDKEMTKIYRIKLTELKKLLKERGVKAVRIPTHKLSEFAQEIAEPIKKDIEKLTGHKLRLFVDDEEEVVYKTDVPMTQMKRITKKFANAASFGVSVVEYGDGKTGIVFPARAKDPGEDLEEKLEERAYNEQYKEIKKAYGQKAADKANYGWGVDEGSIATKVYLPDGAQVLVTSFDPSGDINQVMDHEWEDY